jgi:predicted secreted protein
MTLNEQDAGRIVNMAVGDVVTVRLQENPTTGYRWTVETVSGLDQVGDRIETDGAIGAAGVRSFQFRTTRAGSYELRFKLGREWEGEDSALSRFIVKINVQ